MEVPQLPPCSSEFNPTERLRQHTRKNGTHNRYFTNTNELVTFVLLFPLQPLHLFQRAFQTFRARAGSSQAGRLLPPRALFFVGLALQVPGGGHSFTISKNYVAIPSTGDCWRSSLAFNDVATFEDGSSSEAEIESYTETADDERIDPEEEFRRVRGGQAYEILLKLGAKVGTILQEFGITVLPAAEWRKPVPWFRDDDDSLSGIEGKAVRVLDTLFFEEL